MDRKLLFLGVLIGVASSTAVNMVLFRLHGGPPLPPGFLASDDEFLNGFAHHLRLSEEQKSKAKPFVAPFHRAIVQARIDELAATERAMDTLGIALKDFLDEPQRRELEEMKERISRMQGDFRPHGGPPPF
jgi:hypothetical protein